LKTLLLLRHAKSAWDIPGLADRERGLKKRGIREASLMGAALVDRVLPDSIYVSSARRAQLTLEGFAVGWPGLLNVSTHTDETLYTFSVDDLFEWLAARPSCKDSVLLISHNPGMTDLVNLLAGEYWLDNVPTAGYVEMRLHIDQWRQVMQGCAEVAYTLFPGELPSR
jgi:phosphohistidine phosphatase